MTYQPRFRNRIITAFCVFGFILSLVYWLFIDISIALVEDMVFENRMKNEIADYLDRRRADPDARLPLTSYICGYIGRTGMPGPLRDMTEGLTPGFYETDGPGAIKGPLDHHVAVRKLPDRDELLYLVYDVGTLKVNERYEFLMRAVLFIISLAVAGLGAGIGVLISGKLIAPLTRLTDQVARSAPDRLPVDLSRQFGNDEIGFLARTLDQSMQRIQSFIQREKRIKTGVIVTGTPVIRAPAAVFRIVVNNLLRNAFTHTPEGEICLTVASTGIQVFNTGDFTGHDRAGFDYAGTETSGRETSVTAGNPTGNGRHAHKGFGFGLVIVRRLCERYGWRLEITGVPGRGTLVRVDFP